MAAHGMGSFARAQSFLDEALKFYEDGRLGDQSEHLQILRVEFSGVGKRDQRFEEMFHRDRTADLRRMLPPERAV